MMDLGSLSMATASGTHQSASAAAQLNLVADFVNVWHAAFGLPTVSTFTSAIDNSFIRVPGLTAAKVRRHPPNSVATAYGHLHATRQGIRSPRKSLSRHYQKQALTKAVSPILNPMNNEYGVRCMTFVAAHTPMQLVRYR